MKRTMKKKIVIIGANDFQNRLILKAKDMGYETHVFAWKDGSIGEKTADFFYPISIIEKEAILKECERIKPCGITSIASDLAVVTVNYVAEKLGLKGNPDSITEKCTNKYTMRRALKEYGVKTPVFQVVDKQIDVDLTEFHFPIVVKPTDRSGSRAITKLYSRIGMKEAIEEACSVSFEKKAIIEEFIEGEEYSCECISYEGRHHCLAITKKFTTGEPHYIETGHMEPSGLTKLQCEKVEKRICEALEALGIMNGASHAEFKFTSEGEIGIIEIGARMGGDCIGSDLVYLSTGYDYLKMVIETAVGIEPAIMPSGEKKRAIIKFIFSLKDIEEMEEVKVDPNKEIYRISEMEYENLGKTIDSSSRIGYYIYTMKE